MGGVKEWQSKGVTMNGELLLWRRDKRGSDGSERNKVATAMQMVIAEVIYQFNWLVMTCMSGCGLTVKLPPYFARSSWKHWVKNLVAL
jgi:hypothetical protein